MDIDRKLLILLYGMCKIGIHIRLYRPFQSMHKKTLKRTMQCSFMCILGLKTISYVSPNSPMLNIPCMELAMFPQIVLC